MKHLLAAAIGSALIATLSAQQPEATPKKDPFAGFGNALDKRPGGKAAPASNGNGMKGSALDRPASGGPSEPVNDIEIIKATYGVPGRSPQPVASKLRRILKDGNASSTNKVSIVVSENIAQFKTQTEATYRGTIDQSGSFTMNRDARPVLTVIYRVAGVQKMVAVALGDTLVMP